MESLDADYLCVWPLVFHGAKGVFSMGYCSMNPLYSGDLSLNLDCMPFIGVALGVVVHVR